MIWWLISDDVVQIVKQGLTAPTHERNSYNCNPLPYNTCSGCEGDDLREKALYEFETGLNQTSGVPRDFRFCPECGQFKPEDDRVKNGMKCAECAG